MFQTTFTSRLQIALPIVQGPIGPATTPALAAAVSNAGGLGSLTALLLSPQQLGEQIERTRELTDRPFAVNHVLNQFNPEAFAATLAARPAVVSFALGDPGEFVAQVHDAGLLAMQQVVSVAAAYRAAEQGIDVIIAQGAEAGGNSGLITTLALVPQVVDAVTPIPVLAAGGIADGRGLAAMLMLGAAGVNLGTRFLASAEAASGAAWQHAIIRAGSGDVTKFTAWNRAFPPADGDYYTVPSSIVTAFVDDWSGRERRGEADGAELRAMLLAAARTGQFAELVPLAGQSVGLIGEVLPAAEVVERIADQARTALATSCGQLQ